ncbi:hypothetical protein F443_20714 [Plasmopara halstedii]|uniref:Uncharacterized protein n=1 Tax=Plasmopara halstedii TaxID=4781 RepID=A0A0P1ALZ5_PLAHL|nr:hypothetical protein F443_20714 [Plasmopara halstedii]CEG42208.1 hypothetical protein F443_20714 [Plasmopara halstedii]|eukprot:XP_024578577.1 hypothetical protein F443_20714 [Plasmopara halstedii]
MSTKKAEVLLGSDNYFHWEFAMRMKLARKGLLAHVQTVKPEAEMTEAWLLNDMKALGLIAQCVLLEHQTKIRSPDEDSLGDLGDLGDSSMGNSAGALQPDHDAQPCDDASPTP